MTIRPPDETIGTAAATELYDLLRIAVEATRATTWRPGDSLESLLAPAVVAIAAEVGKAVRPHADHVRTETMRGFSGFTLNLWCRRCPDTVTPVKVFAGNPTDVADILKAMESHANEHNKENQP